MPYQLLAHKSEKRKLKIQWELEELWTQLLFCANKQSWDIGDKDLQ